jgi:hypothetical protein
MRESQVQAQLSSRAQRELSQRRVGVDYYRIRRRISFPTGMTALPRLTFGPEADNFAYPWATWYAWRLEDRLHALGAWGQRSGDAACRQAVGAELAALAQWPFFNQYEGPDLSSAHLVRVLTAALRQWSWLDAPLREAMAAACARQIERVAPWYAQHRADLRSPQDVLNHPNRSRLLQNIPVIGTLALADAARLIGHALAPMLQAQASLMLHAMLEARLQGHTEAVSYDGYVLDFASSWLASGPPQEAEPFLRHAAFGPWSRLPAELCLPGDAAAAPVLGDVEPLEMPFHFTATARLLAMTGDPVLRWHLEQAPLSAVRAQCLDLMLDLPAESASAAPSACAVRGHYAVTLRSGWTRDDLTLAASATAAQMGHIHFDAGSLVLAIGDRWLIDDPGYQQYLPRKERAFSIGPQAHNAPLIDGQAQTRKQPAVLFARTLPGDLCHAAIDLRECYDPGLGVRQAVRHLWLLGRRAAVVADVFDVPGAGALQWHWHGHPDAAWWCDEDRALIQRDDRMLWVQCPGCPFQQNMIDRPSGSRGHLALSVRRSAAQAAVTWWVFAADAPLPWSIGSDGRSLETAGQRLNAQV